MRQVLALALLGTETRYVARLYLIRVAIVAFAIATVVLALDIAGNFEGVMAASGQQALPSGVRRVAVYLLLRLAYNLPAILPLAAAIGIVWAEWTLARSFERMIIVNTGRSPFVSLVPALLVSLLVGGIQYSALSVIRPMAVAAQGTMGFRYYGPRLSGLEPEARWILLDGAVMHARISFPEGEALFSDVTLFELGPDHRLSAAASAPQGRAQDGRLTLDAPQRWPQPDADGATEATEVFLDPVWLRNIGIEPRFVPQRELAQLARGGPGVINAGFYRATLQDRRAAVARLVAMGVLMATLSLSLMRPRMSVAPALKLAAAGYGLHFLSQFLSTLGQNGQLATMLAFWVLPGAVIILCVLYHLWREGDVARAQRRIPVRSGRQQPAPELCDRVHVAGVSAGAGIKKNRLLDPDR